MKNIFFYPFLLIAVCLHAQDYKVSLIPDSLKDNANAVQRSEELHIIVKDIDKAVIKHKCAITILNEAGDKFASFGEGYSKLRSLNYIVGRLFDADGNQLKKIKEKDMTDLPDAEWFEFVTDDRKKEFSFYHKTYPYTVEFESEIEFHGIYSLGAWQPMATTGDYSVQESKFIVETPVNYNLRYKQFNYPGKPIITTVGNTMTYNWEVLNQPVVQKEVYAPTPTECLTTVIVAPTKFSIGGYNGDMSSWTNLGKFNLELNKGRSELPENVKKDIHRIADALPTWQEKVDSLYSYMQQNTRYIYIGLGIGGWQPLEAKFVAEKKYGDCKALSNYMVSILKEAGITAHYVVVDAGEEKQKGLWEDFPVPYFNHIICCVPNGNDTIWLECTSQTESAGYMGSFTGNRAAMMVTDSGGVVVRTPSYPAEANKSVIKVEGTISDDGTLKAEVNILSTGLEQEVANSLYHNRTQKQRDEYYNKAFDLSTYKAENISYKETKGKIPSMNEHVSITADGFATITGKRIFIHPNLIRESMKLPTDQTRKFDIVYPYSYIKTDSIILNIPTGYTPEALPKDVSIKNKFGSYSIAYSIKGNSIELIRTVTRSENRFPASDYPDMVKFYDDMNKADRARMVFVKG